MNFNPNIPPPNGYVFRDTDGTLHKATSWRALERKVIAYRNQIGGNTNDVWDEILRQVCETTPAYCRKDGERSAPSETRDMGKSHKGKIIRFLGMVASAKQNNHLRYVSDAEAQERAKKCQGCPHRTHVDIGCQSCKNTITGLRKQCLGNIVSRAPALGLCGLSEADLPVAIHIVEQADNDGRLPRYCWRRPK
jgi:hypothetical protein